MSSKNNIDKAYDILKTYNGTNNRILYLKRLYSIGQCILGDFDVEYINNNYDYEPYTIGKIVKITREMGLKLQEKYELDFLPEKIKISTVIGEMGNSLHCYVQYRQSVPSQLMYINRNAILNDLEDVDWKSFEVDFSEVDKKRPLREHQKEGVKFLLANKKCILADSMGLGKTTTSISAAMMGNFNKILIITTASLKTTWRKEIEIFEDKNNIQVINGSEWQTGYKFTIVNYDIAQRFYEVAEEIAYETKEIPDAFGNLTKVKVPITVRNKATGKLEYKMKKSRKKDEIKEALKKSPLFLEQFDCVIIDEAHKLSNPKAKRYQVIEDFLKKSRIPYVFLLTGTPITKDTVRFYYVLKLLDANITKDYMFYMRRFCGAKKRTFRGKELLLPTGATHLDELKEKIKNLYIRRELKDMADMVKKTVSTRYYDLSSKQMGEYEKLWSDYLQAQRESGEDSSENYKQLVEGMLVRQYLANQMAENTIKLVNEKIEDDEKVVVMCTFTDELQKFKDYYGAKCVTYDGHMTAKAKDKAFEKFQNDKKVKVFVGNIVAASVGLSLTAAHTLIFNSYSWVFADNNQAEDRIYRLTSTDDVEIIYQLFTDSISEHMYRTVMEKQRILNETIKKESEK
jgi:SWI/SNF-related matrix-associated actin-dependent regulator of chromatin subfamily A-like protein 1